MRGAHKSHPPISFPPLSPQASGFSTLPSPRIPSLSNKSQTPDARKQMKKVLCVEASAPAEAAQLSIILALGMSFAVRANSVTPQYACDKLFRPVLLQQLRDFGVDDSICECVAEALELENIADIVNEEVAPLLDRLMVTLLSVLKDLQGRDQIAQACWVQPSSRSTWKLDLEV